MKIHWYKVIIILLLPSLYCTYSFGQEIKKIDFEQWNSGRELSNGTELKALNISFPNEDRRLRIVRVANGSGLSAFSGEKVAGSSACSEFCGHPIEIEFEVPVSRVSMQIMTFFESVTFSLKGFAENGSQPSEVSQTISRGEWTTVTLTTPIEGIKRFILDAGNRQDQELLFIDDLEFEIPPQDLTAPRVILTNPSISDRLVAVEGEIDLGLEAFDDLELKEAYYEIKLNGVRKRINVCGGSSPCMSELIKDARSISLTDSGFDFTTNCGDEYEIVANAVDAGGNKVQDSKTVTIGNSSADYNPNAQNIKVFRRCSSGAKEEMQLALDLLVANSDEILEDITFYRKRGREMRGKRQRRLKRKYKRKVSKMRKVKCNSNVLRNFCKKHGGRSGGFNRRILVCYDDFWCFNNMFDVFAHEAAHMANIPWNRGKKHNRDNDKDNAYNIGKSAGDWARENGFTHQLKK